MKNVGSIQVWKLYEKTPGISHTCSMFTYYIIA